MPIAFITHFKKLTMKNTYTMLVTGILISILQLHSLTGITQQSKSPARKFGDVKPEDFTTNYSNLDSFADAVYLYQKGTSKHEGNSNGFFSIIYKIHQRIQLLHKESFDDLASVEITLHEWSNNQVEKLDDLEAATYNLEDGKVIATTVDKTSIFKDKNVTDRVVKFTFPNLKEGCIIEYSYTETIPYFGYIPAWSFQGKYPELWSEFTLEIPEFFDFVVLSQGYLEPAIDIVNKSADNFNISDPGDVSASRHYSFRSNTVKHTWAYKNIPALKEENYITNLYDYSQRIEIQLQAIRLPDREPELRMHTWNETVEQLMKDERFGVDLNRENGWLKDDVKAAVKGETDKLNEAKNIYAFIKDNYTCIDHSAIYLSQPLKKTQQTKRGNVADINMLLIAMLRVAGYKPDPVLLSTRGHGKTVDIYPILDKFDYLVARVNIGTTPYLLDCSRPMLGFGHLSQDCYNGDARVIAADPLLISLAADSLRETGVTFLSLINDSSEKISGTYKHVFGEKQSEDIRNKTEGNNANAYFENRQRSLFSTVKLTNTTIDSLKQFEMPVAVQYNLSFQPEGDILYFSPVFAYGTYGENPFKAAKRFYPVEMPYCLDEVYILNMEIPAGYKVDELPKSARVTLNENDGRFEYLIQQQGNYIQLRCTLKLNKATFEPEDYKSLRDFFEIVVKKEGEQIVFKKI